MNTTIRKSWNSNLYLDALGSSSVIAASVLIFLFLAVSAVTEMAPSNLQVADTCPPARHASIDYADQRPAAAVPAARTACA
ncbi:MAG: hypothetical protein ABI790_03320 [Betaproteobacteria bacterium]